MKTRYGVCLLLGLALCLKGAKDPLTFFIWGTLALAFLAWGLLDAESLSTTDALWRKIFRDFRVEFTFAVWILYAQYRSLDPSVSFYPTTQALLFLFLWMALRSSESLRPAEKNLTVTILVLGAATLLLTLSQYAGAVHDLKNVMASELAKAYGFLPANPTFNAIFMCSASTFLLTGLGSNFSPFIGIGLALMVLVGPSRISLLSLASGWLYLFWPRITVRWVIGALAALTVLMGIIPNRFWERRFRLNEGNYRVNLWTIARLAAYERPLTGYGLGNFESAYEKYAFPVETDLVRYSRTTSFAHNEYLQAASDLGFPGFVLFLLIVGRVLLKPIPERMRPFKAALISLCVAAFYIQIWHVPFLAFWTLILAAMLEHSEKEMKSSPIHPLWLGGGLAAIVCCAVSLGWSAYRYQAAQNGHWDSIVRWNPKDATAWQQAAYQRTNAKAGLDAFSRATQLVPENTYFQEAYARALEQSPDGRSLNQAIEHYRIAIKNAPYRAINSLAVGRLLFRMKDYRNALLWFKAARRIEPHYWECDLWIARCWKELGDPARAVWVLQNLTRRRKAYFDGRARMLVDLPTPNASSSYEQNILAYDAAVLETDLSKLPPRRPKADGPRGLIGARTTF